MQENANSMVSLGGGFWDVGVQTSIYKGSNGRLHEFVSPVEEARYEQLPEKVLGRACAHWFTMGEGMG